MAQYFLRLLFPKKYTGLGLPAVDYKRPMNIHDKGRMCIAPLSRLPQVKEHIQELGKELSPHLDDLETLLQELREISSRNIIKGSRTMKEVEHTLHREYLHALLEAMGRGI